VQNLFFVKAQYKCSIVLYCIVSKEWLRDWRTVAVLLVLHNSPIPNCRDNFWCANE